MHNKRRRISTRVHDRKIDRAVARYRMKKSGVPKPNKKMHDNWREWAYAGEEKR